MQRILTCAAIIAGSFLLLFAPELLAQTSRPTTHSLAWLAGCWQLSDGKSITDEQWTKPAGGMMLGVSRTVVDGRASWYENTRIVDERGDLVFIARPSQAKEDTPFKLKSYTASKWVFENLENDFPQRVIYMREGKNLTARIEGKMKGNDEAQDFRYKRVKCE